MTAITHWLHESIYTTPLSPACTMCSKGAKMVILITGLCPASCFYCPLSLKKTGRDLIFADEWNLPTEKDTHILLKEAQLIDAKGAGITGGDPLSVPDRTIHYISLLKDTFGDSFHIHLYTTGTTNTNILSNLASVGLDEIRFHPLPQYWNDMNKSSTFHAIQNALKTSMDVALEIPVIPDMTHEILQLIEWADTHNLKWINLNELEYSEHNEKQLRRRGFYEKTDVSAAVYQSQETAYTIIKTVSESDCDIGIHYCSSSFKDGVQLKNRMLRRAHHIAKPIDIITDDSTLLKGIIQTNNRVQLQEILHYIKDTYHLTSDEYYMNTQENQLQIPLSLLEHIAETLQKKGVTCFISEQYPTKDQLEVERIPLPYKQ